METTCPKGFTKLKSGKCQRIVEETPQQPDCPRNFFFNKNTGDCEPVRLNVPRACPEGTFFNRKRQRCMPVVNEQEPTFDPGQNDEPNIQVPQLNLNKNILRLQKKCPEGTAPDKNGRCVPIQ